IQGSTSQTVYIYTNVQPGTTNAAATAGAPNGSYPGGTGTVPSPLPASDLAGNPVSGGVSASTYQIDLQAPAITGPSLSPAGPYFVNQPAGGIGVTFGCSDAGSGVKSGGCAIAGAPAGYTPNGCSGTPAS